MTKLLFVTTFSYDYRKCVIINHCRCTYKRVEENFKNHTAKLNV